MASRMLARKPMSREELRKRLKPLAKGGIRTAKVLSIKDAIASGLYDIDPRLPVAIDRLLDDLEGKAWRRMAA